jgi:hypothetical protein
MFINQRKVYKIMKKNISVINPNVDLKDPEQKTQLFDQYKIFLDATKQTSAMRKDTNSFYITINSVVLSTVGAVGQGLIFPDKSLIFILTLMVIGIGSVISWVSVLTMYTGMEYESYIIIKELESHFPSSVSTRFNQWVAKDNTPDNEKAFIVKKERIIPYAFLIGYTIFLISDLIKIYVKVS